MSWQAPSDWDSRPVCVLGAGVLGRRIAACFVAAGHRVNIFDPSGPAGEQAVAYIDKNIGAYTALTTRKSGSYVAFQVFEEAVKSAWVVFEAVPEILSLKEDTFANLERFAPADCILGSNSSSYKTSELLGKVQSQQTKARILNTHYMMPPEAVIVELMTCGHTDDTIFPFLVDRCKEAGLHPVIALKESTGFIFNRIWAAIKREVLMVLQEGVATPEMIDSIWIEQYSGKRAGPCMMMDSVGLDTVQHIEQHYVEDRKLPRTHLDWLGEKYINKGTLGLKSGKGGLYPPPGVGETTKILVLNTGLGEPLDLEHPEKVLRSGQILSFNVNDRSSRPVQVLGQLEAPDGIDISTSTGRMYWTNMGVPSQNNGSVQSANLDGSDVRYVVEPGQCHTPKQIIIDQESNKIYFCDREGMRILRVNLDGGELETIVQNGDWETEADKKRDPAFWCVGITLSKKLNRIFWTQKGHSKANEGRILSAGIEMPAGATASSRGDVETVISGLPECIDLEFDDDEGVLYWTDRGDPPYGNTLNRKQIIGTPPPAELPLGRQILAQGLGEGIGLRLDRQRDCLYVADLGGHLWQCATKPGIKDKLYEGPTHAYTGLTFYKE